MQPIRSDLRAYYDDEARGGRRGEPTGRRVDVRRDFVELLRVEARRSVLDIGSGPGSDAAAFTESGVAHVGVDLSPSNGVLARSRGRLVIAASLFDLPFRAASFDAGWSMSTLMHVPDGEADDAVRAMLAPFVSGAPIAVGMWGGDGREFVSDPTESGVRRFFSLRTPDHNRSLLGRHADVEHFEVWPPSPQQWEYHYAILRCR